MAAATLILRTNQMPIFGWIRDALGLHKDIIDSKKSKLEVDKLEDEKLERQILTRATMEDIEKYDPKVRKLKSKIDRDRERRDRELIEDGGIPSGCLGVIYMTVAIIIIKWRIFIPLLVLAIGI